MRKEGLKLPHSWLETMEVKRHWQEEKEPLQEKGVIPWKRCRHRLGMVLVLVLVWCYLQLLVRLTPALVVADHPLVW